MQFITVKAVTPPRKGGRPARGHTARSSLGAPSQLRSFFMRKPHELPWLQSLCPWVVIPYLSLANTLHLTNRCADFSRKPSLTIRQMREKENWQARLSELLGIIKCIIEGCVELGLRQGGQANGAPTACPPSVTCDRATTDSLSPSPPLVRSPPPTMRTLSVTLRGNPLYAGSDQDFSTSG